MNRNDIMNSSDEKLNMMVETLIMGSELEEGQGIFERVAFLEKLDPVAYSKPNLVIKDDKAIMGQREIPKYSTELNKAMKVAEKFDYFYLYRSKDINHGEWECKLTNKDRREYYSLCATAPKAICCAALLTLIE